jgi:hypothetical protein
VLQPLLAVRHVEGGVWYGHTGRRRLLSEGADRSGLFVALLDELRGRPTIAVVEDVHWADEATLDLLGFLARRLASSSALLVLTSRDDELGPHDPLRVLLGDLAGSAITRRIGLPPLSEDAVRVMVGERGLDAAALPRRTGGNPFFVTEILANPDAEAGAGCWGFGTASTAMISPAPRIHAPAVAIRPADPDRARPRCRRSGCPRAPRPDGPAWRFSSGRCGG